MPRLGESLRCLTLGASDGVRGASVFVPAGEPGPGTPLFLAAGLGLDGRCFEPLAPLARDRRVVFWNLPNAIPDTGGLTALARLYLAQADLAGMPARFVFGGSSLGGTIALAAALETPERCAGLVVAGASGAWADLGWFLRFAPAIHRWLPRRTYHRKFAAVLFPGRWGRSETLDALRHQAEHRTKDHVGAVIQLLRDETPFDLRERFCDVTAPVLVLHDPADATVPFRAARTMSRIKCAKVVEVPQGGHLPFIGATELCLAEMRSFLAGIDAATSNGRERA